MPSDNDFVGIVFGVEGAFNGGASYNKIKQQLHDIINAFGEDEFKVKLSIDKEHFKKQIEQLANDIKNELGINLKDIGGVGGKGGKGGGSGEAKKQSQAYLDAAKALNEWEKATKRVVRYSNRSTEQWKAEAKAASDLKKHFLELSKAEGLTDDEKAQLSAAKDTPKETFADINTPVKADAFTKLSVGASKAKGAVEQLGQQYADVIKHTQAGSTAFEELQRAYQEYEAAINSGNLPRAQEAQRAYVQQLGATRAELSKQQVEYDNTFTKIRETFSSKLVQRFAYAVIGFLTKALKEVYDNVVKIDTAMTQLRIVTNASEKEMERYADVAEDAAQRVGASVVDIAASTTVFARLGYSLDDAATLAEKASIYSKVAAVDINDATQNITATIKAFGVSANGLEDVLDQFVWVGNNFAISSAEIGEGMNNAASSLAANGNTLQQAIGILTAANVTAQNASRSSTAVRTIAARLARSSMELEDLGDEGMDSETYARLEKQMRAVGVSITDANGELRSTYDILQDLSGEWENLSTTERAAIAEMMAGTRQQNIFYSIMQNWKDAEAIVQNASMGIGSLQAAQEKYLDSIEGRTAQLKAAWEGFSQTILSSDLVKVIMQTLTWIVRALDTVVEHVGGLPVLLTTVGAIIMVLLPKLIQYLQSLKANIQQIQKTGIIMFVTTLTTVVFGLLNTIGGEGGQIATIVIGTVIAIVAAVLAGIKAVETGIMSNGILAAISLILSLIIAIGTAIAKLVKKNKNQLKDAYDESLKNLQDTRKEIANLEDQLDEINKRIKEINNQGGLTLTDANELKNLEQQRMAIERQLQTQKEMEKEQQREFSKNMINSFGSKRAESIYTAYEGYHGEWWEHLLAFMFTPLGIGLAGTLGAQADGRRDFGVGDILEQWETATDEMKEAAASQMQELYSVLAPEGELPEYYFPDLDGQLEDWQRESNAVLDDFYDLQDKWLKGQGEFDTLFTTVWSRGKYADAISKLKEIADGKEFTDAAFDKELQDAIANNTDGIKTFLEYLEELELFSFDNLDQLKWQLLGIDAAFAQSIEAKSLISIFEELEGSYNALVDAMDEMNERGYLSAETVKSLCNEYPELNKYLVQTAEGYKLAENALQDFLTAHQQEYTTDLINATAAYNKKLTEYDEKVSGGSVTQEDYQELEKQKAILETAIENADKFLAVKETLERTQLVDTYTDILEKQNEALEKQRDEYEALCGLRKDLLSTYQEELDYQKELNKKQQNVADLRAQLALAQLDNSASGQARARELESQLNEAEDELDEYTLDHAIEDIQASIDSEMDEYKNFIQTKLDEIKTAIENIKLLTNDDIRGKIESNGENSPPTSTGGESFNSGYKSAVEAAGQSREQPSTPSQGHGTDTQNIDWNKISVKSKFGDSYALGQNIVVTYGGKEYEVECERYANSKERQHAKNIPEGQVGLVGSSMFLRKKIAGLYYNIKLGKTENGNAANYGTLYQLLASHGKTYHTGGFVGDYISLRNNEEFAKLLKGEFVSTPRQMDDFMRKTLPTMMARAVGNSATINNNSPLVEIKCGSVDNDTLPKLKTLVDEAVKKIEEDMDSALHRVGYKKKF